MVTRKINVVTLILIVLFAAGCASFRPHRAAQNARAPLAEAEALDMIDLCQTAATAAQADFALGFEDEARTTLDRAETIVCSRINSLPHQDFLFEELADLRALRRELWGDEFVLPKDEISQWLDEGLTSELSAGELKTLPDIQIQLNSRVAQFVSFYTSKYSSAGPALRRGSHYLPEIFRILARNKVPREIAAVALVESGFQPFAVSTAHAVGMWQFIKSTALLNGLTVNWWTDERCDPLLATEAACRFLRQLYEQFNDWHLAIAAYNCGPARIDQIIARTGITDYWDPKFQAQLPRETRNYVPAVLAGMVLMSDPAAYGLEIPVTVGIEFDEVTVDRCLDLALVAEFCESDREAIAQLNSSLLRGCTPPEGQRFTLRLPKGRASAFMERYAELPELENVKWSSHRVATGDTLPRIARQYGVNEQLMAQVNLLPANYELEEGTSLLLPVSPRAGIRSSAHGARASAVADGRRVIRCRIRRGDTLSTIASRYNVRVQDLKRWNNLRSSRIVAGETLLVHVRGEATATASAPAPSGQTSARIYRVQQGDSLWKIARSNGLSVDALRKANGLSGNHLKPGDKLTIPAH